MILLKLSRERNEAPIVTEAPGPVGPCLKTSQARQDTTNGMKLAPVPVYPLGAWGGGPRRAWISWTEPDFLVINFDPSVPRGPVDLLRPGPEMSLNRH
ncbi:hypothetical protein TNCV_2881981 [Trichonephila clavipes]|nr:hypothetical protein TNCV_2881981 [Trichonephila clavipes]